MIQQHQQNGSALPTDRAFVIQFSSSEGFAGRAEHVSSGDIKRFSSWQELQVWVEQTLARVDATRG